MNALVFSWSGSFREDFEERREEVKHAIDFVHERDFEAGVLLEEDEESVETLVEELELDFALGNVENIIDVLKSLSGRYEKVFLVTDVRAEIASANQSGVFTVGYNSGAMTAEELGGVGPNYIVDSLEELEKILELEILED